MAHKESSNRGLLSRLCRCWRLSVGATTLDHEVLDYTVKVKTVVEFFIHEFEEVTGSLGAIFSVETYRDLACTRRHLHYSRHDSAPARSAQEHDGAHLRISEGSLVLRRPSIRQPSTRVLRHQAIPAIGPFHRDRGHQEPGIG